MRDNIEAFGGDPARVMIYGQSGGAGKVVNLMGMPPAPVSFTRRRFRAAARAVATRTRRTPRRNDCSPRSVSKSNARDLQKVPLDQLMKVAAAVKNDAIVPAGAQGLEFRWGPVIDGAVLPADPNASEISKDVPVVVGATRTERTIYEVDGGAYDKLTEHSSSPTSPSWSAPTTRARVIASYRKQKPKASPYALDCYIGTDVRAPGALAAARARRTRPRPGSIAGTGRRR